MSKLNSNVNVTVEKVILTVTKNIKIIYDKQTNRFYTNSSDRNSGVTYYYLETSTLSREKKEKNGMIVYNILFDDKQKFSFAFDSKYDEQKSFNKFDNDLDRMIKIINNLKK